MIAKNRLVKSLVRTKKLLVFPLLFVMVLASCQVAEDIRDNITDFVNDRFFNQKGKEPIADAGPDRTALVGIQIVLDGSGSRDPNNDPLGFIWAISSQPSGSTATLSGVNDVRPTFTPDQPGNYVIILTVTDGHFNSTEVAITITALLPGGAVAPFANAGPDQVVATNSTVTLNGSGSGDVNGDTLSFTWTLVSAPTGSTATLANSTTAFPTFVPNIGGDYVVQLVVSDGIFTSDIDLVTITANAGPVANAGADQTAVVGQVVILDGSGSSDSDGDPLFFSWTIERAPQTSTALLDDVNTVFASFVPDVPGTYIIRLIVSDGKAFSSEDTMVLNVSAIPTTGLPAANAGADLIVSLGSTVILNGRASSDPTNDPLTFLWNIVTLPSGSGAFLNNNTSATPSFVADVVGTYIIELVVSDGILFSQPDTVVVTTDSPVAVIAGGSKSLTLNLGDAVVLNGTNSFDLQGDPLTFAWSFQSIPGGSTTTLGSATAAITSFIPDTLGDYVVQLIVSDPTRVASQADVVTISVSGTGFQPATYRGIDTERRILEFFELEYLW